MRLVSVKDTRESLLSTIRALLEMTEACGCTKAEAAAARAKAFDLMERYRLTIKDLICSAEPHNPVKTRGLGSPDRADAVIVLPSAP